MERKRLLSVLVVAIPLLVFQFSCATVEKKEVEKVPSEKAVEKPAEAVEKPAEAVEKPAEIEKAPEVLGDLEL